MTRPKPHHYLVGVALSGALAFGLLWLYVLMRPIAFLESGYPVWAAKQKFISDCDLGRSMISGDSLPEAAIDPRGLEIPSRNLSFGGSTPIEGYFFIRHALSCAKPPRQIILTYATGGFSKPPEYLWENAARYGFLNYGELNEISDAADALHDNSIDSEKNRLGLRGKLRNLLYAAHFPPLYFSSLLAGQLFRRTDANLKMMESVRQALGHVPYARHGEAPPLAIPQDNADSFAALPMQNMFLERTIALAQEHNAQIVFVAMPISEAAARRSSPAKNKEFESYLVKLAKRYPSFHVVEPLVEVWPDRTFIDGLHLEAGFAARFTAQFNVCQKKSLESHTALIPCDLSWATASAVRVAN